jgi:Zn-finger nucleic acid-binding protein
MKVEALNCPNCGAAVSSDAAQCQFCRSRLKTFGCPSCLGLMFLGSRFCPHCGAKAVQTEIKIGEDLGECPRCRVKLNLLQIAGTVIRECERCDGMWADVETFENICADRESQAAVLSFAGGKAHSNQELAKVNYVPCPDCKQLMNRSNFARSSGVIVDICKQHGVWFDAEELPKIIEFIHKGGMEMARKREKLEIDEQRDRLRDEQRRQVLQDRRFNTGDSPDFDDTSGIRSFVRLLFD